jgi:hypothetical protein
MKLTHKLFPEDVVRCGYFADAQVPTSKITYAKRGQTNPDKIKRDIVTGKMGELGVHRAFKDEGYITSEPDFAIYKGRGKSFAADLMLAIGDEPIQQIHVKTQSADSMKRYGLSWIFQYGGNGHGHVDPMFKGATHDNQYFIGASYSGDDTLTTTIHCAMRLRDVFACDLMKEPALDWLKNSKRAIYMRDIELLEPSVRFGMLVDLLIDFPIEY